MPSAQFLEIIPLKESVTVQTALTFNTEVLINNAGAEQRVINWESPIRTFNLARNWFTKAEKDEILFFFDRVKGSRASFLYKDKSDYILPDTPHDLGNDIFIQSSFFPNPSDSGSFWLTKQYSVGTQIHVRVITAPDIATLIVKSGEDLITDWEFDPQKCTFTNVDFDMTVGCEFYTPVRLESDVLEAKLISRSVNGRKLYQIPRLILKEVRELEFNVTDDIFPVESDHTFALDFYWDTTEMPAYNTKIESLSSGIEARSLETIAPVWLTKLGAKQIVSQAILDYLLCLWLCFKGQGIPFLFDDQVSDRGICPCRFNGQSFTYSNQASRGIYEINDLELRVFKGGIPIDGGTGGYLSSTTLTLARCIQIESTTTVGNLVRRWTTHDRNLFIAGQEYHSQEAIYPNAIANKADLSVNNQEVKGALGLVLNQSVFEQDLLEKFYDSALIYIGIFNYASLPSTFEGGFIESKGIIGEIKYSDSWYTFENLTKAATLLNQSRSIKTSPMCRYVFGDSRCTKNLLDYSTYATITQVHSANKFSFSITDPPNFPAPLSFGVVSFKDSESDHFLFSYPIFQESDGGLTITLYENVIRPVFVGDEIALDAGCDKQLATCRDVFNNTVNFGGFPSGGNWMPGNNFLISSPTTRT